jgi:hypothetical protein
VTDWQQIGLVLLFSVPPGIGVVGFVAVGFNRGSVTPVGIAAGVVTTFTVGALVAYSYSVGERDEDAQLEIEYPDEKADDGADDGSETDEA